MPLTKEEKDAFIRDTYLKDFNKIWQHKNINTGLFDYNGIILAMSDESIKSFGLDLNYGLSGKSMSTFTSDDIIQRSVDSDEKNVQLIKDLSRILHKL